MRIFKYLFVVFIVGLSCKNTTEPISITNDFSFSKEGDLTISKTTSDATSIPLAIEIAETEYETQTGLMHRSSMQDNQGMLFLFPKTQVRSFYMKNTQLALDIIFIDENWKIASFQENAKPFDESSLSSQVPIRYVLEVNAGLANTWNLQIGDSISYTRN